MVGPSRYPLEEVLVDWDKEETEFPTGTGKGVAKDNWPIGGPVEVVQQPCLSVFAPPL
jgi:hypothetical protein